jgi:hypothetical protein
MAKKDQRANQHHVVPRGDNWAVEKAGSERASAILPTKKEAVDVGREISRNQGTELKIHDKKGRIKQSDSHGHDPHPPEG